MKGKSLRVATQAQNRYKGNFSEKVRQVFVFKGEHIIYSNTNFVKLVSIPQKTRTKNKRKEDKLILGRGGSAKTITMKKDELLETVIIRRL